MAFGTATHKCVIVNHGGEHDTDADKNDPNVTNPWKWEWLEFVPKSGARLGDSCRKITKPGFAFCIVCNKEIKYAKRGRSALVDHVGIDSHPSIVKLRKENTLLEGKLELNHDMLLQ